MSRRRKDELMIYQKRCDTENTVDVSEDFVLPDYCPEVRRVLGVTARASVGGKYLSGEELEADGDVTYTVVYMGGEGEICQSSRTSAYTGHIPLKTEEGDRFTPGDIVLSCAAEGINCRVTSPRRITLSSRVKLRALSCRGDEFDLKSTARQKKKAVKTARVCEIRHEGDVSGEIREREGSTPVTALGEICVSDARISSGAVKVKGEAYLTVLMRGEDGVYFTSRSRAPIDDEVRLPDSFADKKDGERMTCAVFASVTMTEVKSGEGGTAWSMEYTIDADVMRESESEITDDAYLPDVTAEEKKTCDIGAVCALGAASGRLTFGGKIKTDEGARHVMSWGSGEVAKVTSSDGKLSAEGEVKLCAIVEKDGEYSLCEGTFPLKYECDGGMADGSGADMKRCVVRVCDVTAREEGDGLNLTAELSVSVFALSELHETAVTEVTPAGEKTAQDGSMIRVYVPDSDETDWDVEKKFRLGYAPKAETISGREMYII